MNALSTPGFSNCLTELRRAALYCLSETCIDAKVQGVWALSQAWDEQRIALDTEGVCAAHGPVPGRPALPELVSPLQVKPRSMRTEEGRAALIHALAHIEFNAINLALDAVWRFPGMPARFYADWLQVAAEEAKHFSLLSAHLAEQGFHYIFFTRRPLPRAGNARTV
jgi:uncharacterized ferritin-like protein (DUF455 family)